MKNILFILMGGLLLVACSTPKQAYYFDYHNYNSGKKPAKEGLLASDVTQTPQLSPLVIEEESLVASNEEVITPAEPKVNASQPVVAQNVIAEKEKEALTKKYSAMTKDEKKEFRKELKTELKQYIKNKKSGDRDASLKDSKAMDHHLKMAIIFGAVGVTLSLFGGVNSVFWVLSVVSIVVAVVFLIMWLSKQ